MRFGYYDNLTPAQKAIYRQSDQLDAVPLRDPAGLRPLAAALEAALEACRTAQVSRGATHRRAAVERAAAALADAICLDLGVPALDVRVLQRRPRRAGAELHGLYEWTPGKRAAISLWMTTAEHRRTVAFRTFLRTLLHEVCHHLDYQHFGLADSFHTEGFFRRESSLQRALLPREKKPSAAREPASPARPKQLRLL